MIATSLGPNRWPHSMPMWFVVRDGEVWMWTYRSSQKVRNLERDPRASLTIVDLEDIEQYIEIRGTATVTEDPGRALAVALGEKYEGPGGGDGYLALPPEVVRMVVRITPTRVVTQ